MARREKKRKPLWRRILKWTGITFLLLIILAIIIPIIFKDEIKEMVLKEVNKTLNAEVSLEDFDLTFISTFPNFSMNLHGAKVQGVREFKDVELANIKRLRADINIWNVMSGEEIEIDAIHVYEPKIDVRVLQTGKANYDIVKPDSLKTEEELTEPSAFKLTLQKYSIENGSISYVDNTSNMSAKIVNLNHEGKGDMTADVIDFVTSTTMDELSFDMDGVSYLTKVKTDADINLLMEFKENTSKFTLKENTIALNSLNFSIDGFYEMLQGYDNMDIKLNADKATFKEFLSLIPTFYQSGYESMIAKGNLAINGQVKGKMDDKNLPGWDFGMLVEKASIKYPDLPGSINNINIKAGSQFKGGENLDLMTLDVSKFHADFVGNTLDATLKMRNPMTDPLLQSGIRAKVDLATLGKVVPLAEGEKYSGLLEADVKIDGRMSALEREDYEAFKALGTLSLKNMIYASPDLKNEVNLKEMVFLFSPQNLTLEKLEATTGKSDFSMKGAVDNYMAYLFKDELLKGNFSFNSNNLDLDEIMNISTTTTETGETQATASSTETGEPILIPANIDFDLNTSLSNVVYNGTDIKNVAGRVTLKEEIATLHDLSMNAMGGSILLGGKYDTRDHQKPKMSFNYSLRELDIEQLAKNFLTVGKLAPIAKYAKGKISSNFSLSSDLTSNFEPIYTSLTGLGDFSSNVLSISGFKPLDKIGDVTNLNNLSSQTIKDVKAKFSFTDGKMNVNPFNVNLGKIKTEISGFTAFDQNIDYDLKMFIPKDQIPASMIKSTEAAIAKVNKLAPKLNVAELPAELPIKVDVLGTVLDPKVSTNFKEALMEATGNMKDQLISNIKDTAKDSVKSVINNQVEGVKEDVEAKKQKILSDAQKQADKVKAEAKKAADAVRAEADKQAEALIAEAGSNPIKKKAAQVAGDKLKKEAEEKAKKIEAEGDQKADAIMSKARAEADKL